MQFSDIVGQSVEIRDAIRLATLTATTTSNILLQGESGTGKEIFAQAIHNRSAQQAGPFLLGLYAGRGELEERENYLLNVMIQELVVWFKETFGKSYGGIDCQDILQDDPWNRLTRCPNLFTETYVKAKELLEENGFIAAG